MGRDIRTDLTAIRQSLGVCPQHNVLFSMYVSKWNPFYKYKYLIFTKSHLLVLRGLLQADSGGAHLVLCTSQRFVRGAGERRD